MIISAVSLMDRGENMTPRFTKSTKTVNNLIVIVFLRHHRQTDADTHTRSQTEASGNLTAAKPE